jgi:hypothetical protein
VQQKGVIHKMDENDIQEMQIDLDIYVEIFDIIKTDFDRNEKLSDYMIFKNDNVYELVDLVRDRGYVIIDRYDRTIIECENLAINLVSNLRESGYSLFNYRGSEDREYIGFEFSRKDRGQIYGNS